MRSRRRRLKTGGLRKRECEPHQTTNRTESERSSRRVRLTLRLWCISSTGRDGLLYSEAYSPIRTQPLYSRALNPVPIAAPIATPIASQSPMFSVAEPIATPIAIPIATPIPMPFPLDVDSLSSLTCYHETAGGGKPTVCTDQNSNPHAKPRDYSGISYRQISLPPQSGHSSAVGDTLVPQ